MLHPKKIGEVHSFDVTKFCEVVEMLLQGDEVERALWLLDNPPAFYREYVPEEIKKLKKDILGSRITSHAYMQSGLDAEVTEEKAVKILRETLRGQLVEKDVREFNERGITPHIVDMGPGEYFVPIGLSHFGHKFTYWDLAMDENTQAVAHPLIKEYRCSTYPIERPVIFLALEIIEHMPEPTELAVEAFRHCGKDPDIIHLSTPLFTFNGLQKDWRKPCGLPHLRAYTPQEILTTADKIFRGYDWNLFISQIISLRGKLR